MSISSKRFRIDTIRARSSRRNGRWTSRLLQLESLEPRVVLDGQGLIEGTVFQDSDRDGQYGAGESSLAGWRVELQPQGATDLPALVLQNPTPDEWSQFGRFVTAVGDDILLSSHYDEVAGPPDAGAAYLFDGDTGELLRVFQSPNANEADRFSRAVAGTTDRVAIGAPLDNTQAIDAGAVYIFDARTGELLNTLLSPQGGENDQFGRAITFVGDNVLVGARFDDAFGDNAGAAYLFDGDTGELLQSFSSPFDAPNAQFGYTVAAMGENVLVGARFDETGANGVGAVYLFDGRSGNLLQTFANPTQRSNGEASGFGRTVAAVGDNVVVGSRWDDSGVDGAGAAFLFDGSTGELLHTFTSPTPFEGEEFGFVVNAIDDDVLIGARWDNRWDGLGQDSGGAAYLFDGESGALLQTFANPAPGAWDAFGMSVAAVGDRVIVGARDGNAAYVFDAIAGTTTTMTDENGHFEFTGVEDGIHRLLLHPQDGFVQTWPSQSRTYLQNVQEGQPHENNFGIDSNLAPQGSDNHYVVDEDGVLVVPAAAGVLTNDMDPDGDAVVATLVNRPPFGTVELLPSGAFDYTPAPDFHGSDSFTYRVDDGLSRSELTTVTIEVEPVNDAPVTQDNGVWVLMNTPRSVAAPGLLANDMDPDADALQIEIVDQPLHGTVSWSDDGSYAYVPAADYSGPDQFTYRVSDGEFSSNVSTVHVTVSVGLSDNLAESLRVSELNYNPHPATSLERSLGFGNRDRFEFIELVNVGEEALELVGTQLSGSVSFQFFEPTTLLPGERGLLVNDRDAFETRYGDTLNVLGEYDGNLHNSGARITLQDPFDRAILDFHYDDEDQWPVWPDGFGSTLESIDPWGNSSSAGNWRYSRQFGGSPGTQGSGHIGTVVVNEVMTHANLPRTDAIELHNTTDADIDIGGWYLSDSANDFGLFEIPAGTTIPASGYVTFDEHDFNPGRWEPGAGGFAFDSALGDDVWLLATDVDGNVTHFMDHVEFGAALNGQSFIRWPNGTGPLYPAETVTLGSENAAPRVGPIVISEVMYAPNLDGDQANHLEFVEIYNPTTAGLDLRNWEIRGGVDYDFPNSKYPDPITLSPGESFVIVPFDPNDEITREQFMNHYGINGQIRFFGPSTGNLDNSGDTVRLIRADGPAWWEPDIIPRVLEDEVTYGTASPWPAAAAGDGESLSRRDAALWGLSPSSWLGTSPGPGTVDLQAGTLAISEINYSPFAPTADELAIDPSFTANDFEFFELLNIAGRDIDLSGMSMTHGVGFEFPDMTLGAGERIVVASNAAAFAARYGTDINVIGDFSRGLGNGGERLTLLSATETPLLSFSYSDRDDWPERADGDGSTLELTDVFSEYSAGENWRPSLEYGGSPGSAGGSILEHVVINEVLVHPTDPIADRIELYNSTRGPIDVSGWYLSDSGSNPVKFRIPDNTVIPSFSYAVFAGDQLLAPQQGIGFAMNRLGDNNLYLLKPNSEGEVSFFVDEVRFGTAAPGESWGRWPSGLGSMFPMSTPTLDVSAGDNTEPRVGPVVISEVMYHPRDTGETIEQNDLEYVEIYNPTDETVDLADWQLVGGIRYEFQDSRQLAPDEALLIVRFDTTDSDLLESFRLHYGIKPWVDIVGGYDGSLSNQGDFVQLLRSSSGIGDEEGELVLLWEDEVIFDDQAPWPVTADGFGFALHREMIDQWGNSPTSWVASPTTPGIVAPPATSVAISELNYHPYDPLDTELSVDPTLTADDFEFVELVNISGEQLPLDGMHFDQGLTYTFSATTLAPAERVLLAKNPTAFSLRYGDSSVRLFGPYDGEFDDLGERISMVDTSGAAVLRFDYDHTGHWPERPDGYGSTLEIVDVAGYFNDPDNWRASAAFGGSPGSPGESEASPVAINEVVARASADQQEAVELFNRTDESIDLGGWFLTNDRTNLNQLRIPEGSVLPPNGFLILTETDLASGGIVLDDASGDLWLIETADQQLVRFVDQVEYGPSAAGNSYGRWPDGQSEFLPLVSATIDPEHPELGTNNPVQVAGSLIITELNYSPYGSADFGGSNFEFLELQNASPYPYDLSGLEFTDGIRFAFDEGSPVLEPEEFAVIARNQAAFETRYGADVRVVGEYAGGLNNEGELIVLQDASGDVIVELEYDDGDGWFNASDAYGPTLEVVDPSAVPPPGTARTDYLSDPSNWQFSSVIGGTPGAPVQPVDSSVVINEIAFDSFDGSQIELFNTTEESIDISSWRLVALDAAEDWTYEFPVGTTIAPREYFTARDTRLPLNLLRRGGVWLLDTTSVPDGERIVDGLVHQEETSDTQVGRWPDIEGRFVPLTLPTIGEENTSPRVGPLVISELHYHSIEPGDIDDLEFVEIYNPTAATVPLHNWWIQGGIEYSFPFDAEVGPFSTAIVISFNPDGRRNTDRIEAFRSTYGLAETTRVYGGYIGGLSNGGEQIRLMRYDDQEHRFSLEDEVWWDDRAPWPVQADGRGGSLRRVGIETWGSHPNSWVTAVPTPGTTDLPTIEATVTNRGVFYNNSFFDGGDSRANFDDDQAISLKRARFPGEPMSPHHVSSFVGGLTGITIDIDDLGSVGRLGTDDFQFRVGHFDDPSSWYPAPAPRQIQVRPGAGVNGSDRVSFVWDDHAIVSQWLEVTVRATADTGLREPDVFYFASLPGDANGDGRVDTVDLDVWITERYRHVGVDSLADFDRSGYVDATDFAILNAHRFTQLDPVWANPPSGIVPDGTQITLTTDRPGTIYYTTDGTDPRQTQNELISLTGAAAEFLVPTSNTLIDACTGNRLALPNPENCFMHPDYIRGTHGENWTNGSLSIGFGAENLNTEIEPSTSVYVRIPFEVTAEQKAAIDHLQLKARVDDGFTAYLWYRPGPLDLPFEVARLNAPGDRSLVPIRPLAFDAAATAQRDAFDVATFNVSPTFLHVGTNYLVLQVLSQDLEDMSVDIELGTPTGRLVPDDAVREYTGPITIDRDTVVSTTTFDDVTGSWSAMAVHQYVVAVPGDADLDGDVDAADLNAIGTNWLREVDGWSQGDFNDDRVVNVADLNLLAQHWGSGVASAAAVSRLPKAPLATFYGHDSVTSRYVALAIDEVVTTERVSVAAYLDHAATTSNVDAVFLQDALDEHRPRRTRTWRVDAEEAAIDGATRDAFIHRRWRHTETSVAMKDEARDNVDIVMQELVDDVLRHR